MRIAARDAVRGPRWFPSAAIGALFLGAVVAGANGVAERVTEPAVNGIKRYVTALAEAHYEMQQANSFFNDAGDAEYALLTTTGASDEAVASFAAAQPGWTVRESVVSGWLVVAAPAAEDSALALLREQPFTRVALRNRGIWICH